MKAYYDALAPEYDDWYHGLGRFDGIERPHWDEELHELQQVLASLPPKRTLDVACGTGFLTRHLRGRVTGLDQSAAMLEIAAARAPHADFVQADAFPLPFPDDAFERIVTGHFYGHLEPRERESFLADARRVAPELIVVDAKVRVERERESWQERRTRDGRTWDVFKRYFEPQQLAAELGGGEILLDGRWFVVVRSPA